MHVCGAIQKRRKEEKVVRWSFVCVCCVVLLLCLSVIQYVVRARKRIRDKLYIKNARTDPYRVNNNYTSIQSNENGCDIT